jgi:thioredoxin 1
MAGKNVSPVNDLNFDAEVVNSDVPVLVDFTATWCGPCRQIAPLVDQLADEYAGKAKVVKLDIDESPETARRFGIRGVPTILVFKGGEVVQQQVGMAPKTVLAGLIEKSL